MALADAAVGANQAILQMIAQRLQQQQQQFENRRQLGADTRAQQALDMQGENNRLLREGQAQNYASEDERRKAESEQAQFGNAMKLRETIPSGSDVPSDNPAYTVLNKYGLLTGTVKQPGGMGSDFQGPMPTGEAPQSVANNSPRIITAAPTYAQGEKATADQEKRDALTRQQNKDTADQTARDRQLNIEKQNADANTRRAGQSGGGKYQFIQTYTPDGKPGPVVRANAETGAVEPTDMAAMKPPPGAAQSAQLESGKKEALGSLDQLDQAIENAKDLIGPGAGRVSSIQQMIGNADPRISALGTKMLLAKMQVDHAASGTVRAGASPQILSRWDNILGNNQTPEGLKAAVQAMREILGGTATGAKGKPSAADLIKQYGGAR